MKCNHMRFTFQKDVFLQELQSFEERYGTSYFTTVRRVHGDVVFTMRHEVNEFDMLLFVEAVLDRFGHRGLVRLRIVCE